MIEEAATAATPKVPAGRSNASGSEAGGSTTSRAEAGGSEVGGSKARGAEVGGSKVGGLEAGGSEVGGSKARGAEVGSSKVGGSEASEGGSKVGGSEASEGGSKASEGAGSKGGDSNEGGSRGGASGDGGANDRGAKGGGSRAAVWIGIALSIVAVVLLLWRVSFRDLGTAIAGANAIWLVPSVGLFLLMFVFRAWRWSVILGGTPFWATWHANIIGYFFNVTLPLRLGEIARAYVISKNAPKLPMARALSGVLAERLIDLASVVLMFAWFAQTIPMRPAFTRAATIGSVAVVVCVVIGIFVVVKGPAVEAFLRPRLSKLGEARAEALLSKFRQICDGLRIVGSAKRLAQALILTVIIWSLTILLASVMLRAFLPEATDLSKPGLVVVMANLGGALPSAPAGLGIVQGFATSALVVPFHVPEGTALAYVLVWSLSQQLALIVLGFISIGRVGLSFSQIRAGTQTAAPTD